MRLTEYRPTTDLFGPLFEDWMRPFAGWRGGVGGSAMGNLLRAPEADVIEAENEIRVMVELPGLRAEDVSVDLENNILTVSGEKREERTEGDERSTWHLAERRYGKFTRSFVLPRDVEQDNIEARFENGVLWLTVPKSERARRRRIEIRGGNGHGQQRIEAQSSEQRN